MGGVVRDFEGEVLMATFCDAIAIENPELAEACSVIHTLKSANEAGLRNLVVETDC